MHTVVGIPLAPSYQCDSRITTLLESWDRSPDVTTFYAATDDVTVGRDRIVLFAQNLIPRPTHILFVDHDVMPRYTTLKKLLADDKDVVAGVYPLSRGCEIAWCLSREDPFKPLPIDELPDNMFKAMYSGCGMMLVKMEVFDNLEWPYWRNEFRLGAKSSTEDVYFCKKLAKAGYDIWVDPKLKCSHFRLIDLLGVAMNYMKGKKQ